MLKNNLDYRNGSYEERFEELGGVNSLINSELFKSAPIAWGFAVFVVAYIVLFTAIGSGVFIPAAIVGIIVGYYKSAKIKKLHKFLDLVRTKYDTKVLNHYNNLLLELNNTHTEVFKNDSVTGFRRNDEIYIINNYNYSTELNITSYDLFTILAINDSKAMDYLENTLININLADITAIEERNDYFDDEILILSWRDVEDDEETYYRVQGKKGRSKFKFDTFKLVTNYLLSNNNAIKLTYSKKTTEVTNILSGNIPSETPKNRTNPPLKQGNLLSSDDHQQKEIVINTTINVTPTPTDTLTTTSNVTPKNSMEELIKLQKLSNAQKNANSSKAKKPEGK